MSGTGQSSTFNCDVPPFEGQKKVSWLARTDRLFATLQVVKQGGETNLHSHGHLDGFWFVLSGRARFYSDETTLAAELGPREGICIPRGVKYWFESAGEETLELLQVECSDVAMGNMKQLLADRTDFTPQKRAFTLDAGE